MGGNGSGNHYHWWRGSKKTTVEECLHLDANRWMREGILRRDAWQSGNWIWYRDADRREQSSAISYYVNTYDTPPWLRLSYTLTASKEALDYRIELTTTRPRFGGLRWWFLCPLSLRGMPCGRRVAKLYFHDRYYGCRHCHDLTYRSCQEGSKPPAFFRAILANAGLTYQDWKRLGRNS